VALREEPTTERSPEAAASPAALRDGTPRAGETIHRLRVSKEMSLRALADASGLSVSFLRAVERGESDIDVGRLAQVARVFDLDVASLLGYTLRQTRPRLIAADQRIVVPSEPGVEYVALRIPGTSLEFMSATLAPHAGFDGTTTEGGIDVLFVIEGAVVLEFDGSTYQIGESECATWPSSYPHAIRNDTDACARIVGFATETIY
jgi:transcriptional regulator with XRE-family HTH domain